MRSESAAFSFGCSWPVRVVAEGLAWYPPHPYAPNDTLTHLAHLHLTLTHAPGCSSVSGVVLSAEATAKLGSDAGDGRGEGYCERRRKTMHVSMGNNV